MNLVDHPAVRIGSLAICLAVSGGHAAGAAGAAAGVPTPQAELESPELATDRPDFTETAIVVPRGSLQIESGVTWVRGRSSRILAGPEMLFRWGVARRTELRLEVPDYVHATGADRADGFSDALVGFKQQLGPTPSGFEVALIPAVTLPIGARRLTSGAPDPVIAFPWSRDLAEAWSLAGQFTFAWLTEEDDRNFTALATLSLGRELGERWGAFLEYAGETPDRGEAIHLIHHGYTYALSRVSQADLHFGFGLNSAAPRFFIGGGYAVRY
jgi:hypothetical protein